MDERFGRAYFSNGNGLEWQGPSQTLYSLRFIIAPDEPPEDGGIAQESLYTLPSPGISLDELEQRVVIAEGVTSSADGINYSFNGPFNIPSYFRQEGTLSYVVMPLGYFSEHDGGGASFYFFLSDEAQHEYDCRTPARQLFEWGIPTNTRGHAWNEVIIGPFTGTECGIRAVDEDGQPLYSIRVSDQGVDGELGTNGSAGRINVIAYGADPCAGGACVSNVLFLPGIKGSRLYAMDNDQEHQLWDPNGDDDVPELLLDENGKSLRDDIYAKRNGIIDEVPGEKIYDSLTKMFDRLHEEGTINDWEAAAYDWRLSLPDIVNNGAERDGKIYYEDATSTPYIEQTLKRLASDSQTGKVTIIAHSNGGLVAKALMRKLGDVETARLVDRVIFVGVPQSGAPQTLGALLYGDREKLPNQWWLPSFILSQQNARAFAENSPMAYHLLPTQNYFDAVQGDDAHPVARFLSGYQQERDAYGDVIGSFDELARYLRAEDGGRVKPPVNDLSTANVLNSGLITYAQDIHADIDSWVPPAGVELDQIAGWGEDTISGVDFYEECGLFGCKQKYRPKPIEDGDGVVPVPSAMLVSTNTQSVKRYWLNLKGTKKDHGDLLELVDLRDFVESLIENSDGHTERISEQEPVSVSEKKLRFYLHSPLTIELQDDASNQVGIDKSDIDDAKYGEFGDVKYITTVAGKLYTVVMHGIEFGNFSLDIEELEGDQVTKLSTIANVPVTPNTIASFTIENGVEDVSPLSIDENGDGKIDVKISFQGNGTVMYEAPEVPAPSKHSRSSHKETALSTEGNNLFSNPVQDDTADSLTLTSTELGVKSEKTKAGGTAAEERDMKVGFYMTQNVPTDNVVLSAIQWLKNFLYNFFKWLFGIIGLDL